jgi:hypothetical protein
MGVSNQYEARMDTLRILRKSLPGKKSGRRKRTEVAQVVGEAIFLRWRVGPYGWKLKHLLWYFDSHLKDSKLSTRYEHWLSIRSLLERTEKEHMIVRLVRRTNADYLRPKAIETENSTLVDTNLEQRDSCHSSPR